MGFERRFVRPSVDREVDEEFAHHVAMRVRDLVAAGWDEEEARAEAMRRFGDMERLKADCKDLGARRDARMDRRLWWDELRQNLGYAFRQLRRAPGFTAIVVLTLAVAIGANTAVFSVVNAVLLEPMPYRDADDLVALWTRYLPPSGFDIPKFRLSGPELLDIQEESQALETMGAYVTGSRALTGEGLEAERIRVGFYSASLLPMLGVRAELGRWFTPEEDAPGGPEVVILSHDLWIDRYGADPGIVGRTVTLNGVQTEVVGVMPEGFEFPNDTRAWLPLRLDRSTQGGRGGHGNLAVGRLAPGQTLADLDAELAVVRERWAQEYQHNVGHFVWAEDLRTSIVGDAPARLLLLMSAVVLVLLVASANTANLLLARAERRQAEVAVRTTLGAGRGRITRQLATESFVLAGVAAAAGLVLAAIGVRALVAMNPAALPRLEEVTLDGTVLVFTLGVAAATALLFGVAPAYVSGRRAAASLASSTGRAVGGRRRTVLRRALVTGEVALSLIVVILAGLVVRSFSALTDTDPRMDPDNLLTFSLSLPENGYPDVRSVPLEFERLLDAIRAVPGVRAASAASSLPFQGLSQWDFQLDDRPPRAQGEPAWNTGIAHIATDYFETLGIPILEGRGFTEQDAADAPLVAIASQTLAARYWPGERVIGKRIGFQMDGGVPWMTIVGLVPDPVAQTLDREPYQHLYVPQTQGGISTYDVSRTLQIAVRGAVPVEGLVSTVRATVAGFDHDLPIYQLTTMEQTVKSSYAGPRVTTNLLGMFALIALVLAAVGIYGVISYSVAGRTREIGVRAALGAERGEINRMILLEGSRPVIAGIVIGLAGAWYATRLVESMLYGVTATDPLTFSLLPLGLLMVGLMASWIPALRATRISPTEALREE